VEYGVPEGAINFVRNSDEFMEMSYFSIKTGFKGGLFWRFAFNTLHKQLSEESVNYLPGDWQYQLI
jgi:hypothetical protein